VVTEGQRVGLLAEASAAHQAGLLVHLLWAGEVLPVAFVLVAAALEVLTEEPMAVAAMAEALMEEAAMAVAAMAVATGKLNEKVSEEGSMWAFFFVEFLLARILIFTHYYKGLNPTDIAKRLGDSFLNSTTQLFDQVCMI
jgi:hypothetical protein